MRRIATGRTRWVLATVLATMGTGYADDQPRVKVTDVRGVPKSGIDLTTPPPINIRPPSILNLSVAPSDENETRTTPRTTTTLPPRAVTATPTSNEPTPPPSVSLPAVPTPPALPMMPVAPTPPTAEPRPDALPATLPDNQPCNACEAKPTNPWAKVPTPGLFPRLGYFTVPGSGRGYYSLADVLHGECREKPPAFPYPPFIFQPPGFFDADYRYLDNPENKQTSIFDSTKRQHPTPDTMISIGGQHSYRYMAENGSRLSRFDDRYSLLRQRVYADFWYKDWVRIYGEFISAVSLDQQLPALPIDENRADILNLFADVKLLEMAGNPLYARVGRQELLYGSQRLVSTLDWANTRRTFQGVKTFWHSDTFDVDLFWVNPVTIKPTDLDSPDHNVQFFGAWATWKPKKGTFADLYYLGLMNDNRVRNPFFPPTGPAPTGTQEIHTFGARLVGNEEQLLYDFEGMYQFGNYFGRTLNAYAWTAALGWEFRNVPCRPQVWLNYDYASGTSNPNGTGNYTTFQQLFPFGHYYFGAIDAVGRQNINDLSAQLAFYPDHWITVVTQYHHFQLAERRDFLYNAAGRTTRRSATGVAGTDIGSEFDLLVNFHLSQHQDFMIGYSKLFAGDFIKRTGPNVSPELIYLMYNFRW